MTVFRLFRLIFLWLAFFLAETLSLAENMPRHYWCTGYWYSPTAWGNLDVSAIDFSGLTDVIHYALMPMPDGTLDPKFLKLVTDYSVDLVSTAHANGVDALIGLAQTEPGQSFRDATRPANLPRLIQNVIQVMDKYGYDGIDIDWESEVDPEQFVQLVYTLRKQLDRYTPRKKLTGAFWEATSYLAQCQSSFDQINGMTYDNCSPIEGFSWHNAAISTNDSTKRTVDWRISQFTNLIDKSKLGLGIPFYRYVWQGGSGTTTGGVSLPGQTWRSAPTFRPADYRRIITDPTILETTFRRRDQAAGDVPYISIDRPGSIDDTFVTYDDEVSVTAKVDYAKRHDLGGVMLWELSADYLPNLTIAHPLLRAVTTALGMRGDAKGRGQSTF
jgi:chitinase